jgi:hypothetical protein
MRGCGQFLITAVFFCVQHTVEFPGLLQLGSADFSGELQIGSALTVLV